MEPYGHRTAVRTVFTLISSRSTVDSVDKSEVCIVRTCVHRVGASAMWIRNDGKTAPILFVSGFTPNDNYISMTSQVIRISCGGCYAQIVAGLV